MYGYRPLDPRRALLAPRAVWGHPRAIIGGVDGGECDATLLPKIVWPSDVNRFKAQIDPLARATNTSIDQCAGLSAEDKADWGRFFQEWQAFAARSTPTFGSSNEWDHACAASRTIDAWRAKIKSAKCAVVGPEEIKGTENEKIVDAVQVIAKSAIVIGAIVVLVVYAPEIKAGLGTLFGGKK